MSEIQLLSTMSNKRSVFKPTQKDSYCHTKFIEQKGRLIWKISGFTGECQSGNLEKLTSTTFRLSDDETDWHLALHPNGEADHKGYISLFLNSNAQEKIYITCEFSIIQFSGEKSNERQFSTTSSFNVGYGFPEFLSLKKLMEQKSALLPNDDLTICCIVKKKGEMAADCTDMFNSDISVASDNSLSADWGKYYDGRNKTDVVLKVGNKQIFAHKIVLTCRSPVFASMFELDMLEKDTNKVNITDVDFNVLGGLVRFLYTGDVTIPAVDFALNMLIAADKYDVPSLKARCVKYLYLNVSEDSVFQVLKVANACNEERLSRNCMSLIEREMTSVSSLSGWISRLNERPDVLPVIQKMLEAKKHCNIAADDYPASKDGDDPASKNDNDAGLDDDDAGSNDDDTGSDDDDTLSDDDSDAGSDDDDDAALEDNDKCSI